MADITTIEGYIYFTSGNIDVSGNITGGTTVKILLNKIDNNIDKEIKTIKPGVSPNQQLTSLTKTLILDLNRSEQAFTINGMLEHDTGDTIFNKRDNLEYLSGISETAFGGQIGMVYKNNAVIYKKTDCHIKKVMVTETSEKAQKQPLQRMPVTILVIRGTSIG